MNNNDYHRRRRRQRVNEDGEEGGDEPEGDDISDVQDETKKVLEKMDKDDDEKGVKAAFPTSLLNMNVPGTGGSNRVSDPQNAAEQLKTIAQTISQLTANVANNSNPKTVQELAVLQATLFSLQQQQLLQMQILTQMQMRGPEALKSKDFDEAEEDTKDGEREFQRSQSITDLAKKMELQNTLAGDSKRADDLDATPLPPSLPSKSTLANLAAITPNLPMQSPTSGLDVASTKPSIGTPKTQTDSKGNQILDPNGGSLASSIIMHHDTPDDKPAVNSLELLQQRAQGILNNASQGLLANNLADFTCGKDQRDSYEKKGEPFFKHRCRYCGKVFGSDSALQIHVRSHTGERPYKCNVCGNRFTTKGNLKVHFQRHTHKFPHVKMNPNLVPEHLDKFYPSLLQLIEEAEKKGLPMPNINNPMAGMTPVIPPGFRLPNIPGMPPSSAATAVGHLFGSAGSPGSALMAGANLPSGGPPIPRFPIPPITSSQCLPSGLGKSGLMIPSGPFGLPSEHLKIDDLPQNLSRAGKSRSRSVSPVPATFKKNMSPLPKNEEDKESVENMEQDDNDAKPPIKRPRHDGDMDDEMMDASPPTRPSRKDEVKREDEDSSSQDEPQNLSKEDADARRNFNLLRGKTLSPQGVDESGVSDRGAGADRTKEEEDPDHSPIPGGRRPAFPDVKQALSPHSSLEAGVPQTLLPGIDPAKDPIVYTSLLPRPGSNDNAWESLIEVARTSETSKLEQLVNNIEDKLNDPNECFICHRVLSCKSALQMHYRTHTGERPFKCRICSRAFTTKGNLKTHMGVHRAKPPMRMFHQCPVCHKKYANALVLQQHIRTHTGEATDLTAEQIAAAEIRDYPTTRFPGFPGGPQFPPGLGGGGNDSPSPDIADRSDMSPLGGIKDEDRSRPSSVSSSTSSTMLNASSYPASLPASTLASLEQLARTTDTSNRFLSDQRPFGLVRPFQLDRHFPPSIPEDLSSPLRKHDFDTDKKSPMSPPKFSPESLQASSPNPPGRDSDSRSSRSVNGKSPGLGSSPVDPLTSPASKAAAVAAAAAAMDFPGQRSNVTAAAAAAAAASSLLFPGFPGLIPPGAGFHNPLLAAAASGAGPNPPNALSQLGASSLNPAFNPLGLPLPGMAGTRRKFKVWQLIRNLHY